MPDTVPASEKHIASIRQFTLPPEFSNDKPAEPAVVDAKPPAEAPKEPEPAAPEASATPPETPEKEEPGKETTEKVPARLQKRIDRATKLRYEAEARAAQYERELAEAKAKSTPVQDPNEPKMADYTDIAEFGKAMREYGEKKSATEQATKQREEQGRKFTQEITTQWSAQAAKGEVEFEDWEETVGDLKPTSAWAVAIMQEENGYKIAHHLGTHPKEAERIVNLDPYAQVREIAKLAVKLQTPAAPPPKPSKAPAPIIPVSGSASVTDSEIKPQMPYEEYKRIMDKRMGRGVK